MSLASPEDQVSVSRGTLKNVNNFVVPHEDVSPPNITHGSILSANPRAPVEVSDNAAPQPSGGREACPPNTGNTDPPQIARSDSEAIKLVLSELQDIKSQMGKLNTIEATTTSLAEQMLGVVGRTSKLETTVTSNSARLGEIDDELSMVKTSIKKQEENFSAVQNLKTQFSKESAKTVTSMNALIDTQKEQVDSFNQNVNGLRQEMVLEMDKKVNKIKHEIHCKNLKDRAFENRQNLVITGLKEDSKKSAMLVAREFIQDSIGIQNVKLVWARRIGPQPSEGSSYSRPILMRFSSLPQRNAVWRKRNDITSTDDSSKTKIQADHPKELREGMQVMYKVLKAAGDFKKFESAKIVDFQLELNDEIYQVSDLERLPKQIRPSTLATPQSKDNVVFFSKQSFLSNHYPSVFVAEDQTFSSMEHYLAMKRATLSGKQELIDKAEKVQNPLQAKAILNLLKDDHKGEWDNMVDDVALKGLRAKFHQNPVLSAKLCNTKQKRIGEASTNPRWGIGMDLDNPQVLDHTKWLQDGNLLGKLLMKLRQEILSEKESGSKT